MGAERQGSNYRAIAVAGVSSGMLDAIDRQRNPSAPPLQLRSGTEFLRATGDPVALRLFEFAYAHAFAHARTRPPKG